MTQFTSQCTARAIAFSILTLIPLLSYSSDSTKVCKYQIISGDTVCLVPIQYIRNCNQVILLNEGNLEYGLILKERLFDCLLVDSAYRFTIYQYEETIILKNEQINLWADRANNFEKDAHRNRFWRKVAIPSLGLNLLLILLL